MSVIDKARDFAKLKHKGQTDDFGLDYFKSHIEQVVDLVMLVSDDEEMIATAYLHDTIEDTKTTYDKLVKEFGVVIADLVNELTHEGKQDTYGHYFPRLKSRRAIVIKFADRLSNLSRTSAWGDKRRNQYFRKSQFWNDGSDRGMMGVIEYETD